jgi:hypothetical protein
LRMGRALRLISSAKRKGHKEYLDGGPYGLNG